MKLLFTGASGFLGNNIYPLLKDNYSIATIGLALQDNYSANLAIEIPNLTEKYNIVLHAPLLYSLHNHSHKQQQY